MLLEIVLPLAVLGMLLLFVDQLRRLISHAILNRTIRKALETDPGSASLLIAKLDRPRRWPDALAGWIMLVAGIAIAVAGLFDNVAEQGETFQIAGIAIVLGLGVLVYAWFIQRSAPGT